MKGLRWLVIVPLLGLDQCPDDQTVLFIEVEGSLVDEECVNQFFVQDQVPLHVVVSCAVDPTAPVDEPEPEVRCHPKGDVGLRISPTCTLGKSGAITVDVKFDLLFDGCLAETPLDSASVEVLPGEDGTTYAQGGWQDEPTGGGIFGPPQDGTGWLLINVFPTTPVEG